MTTLSIPLPPELAKSVEAEAEASGLAKTDVVRAAIKYYLEDQAVQKVLRAMDEPSLTGDLDELASQL